MNAITMRIDVFLHIIVLLKKIKNNMLWPHTKTPFTSDKH